jgi:hypothetical protein
LSRGYQGDIPDINITDKSASGATNSSRKSKPGRRFGFGGGGSRDRGGEGGSSAKGSSGGVHTNHSIGGTTFALKDIRGDRARGHTEIRHHTPHESEEEIMTYNGIMRTTDYTVTRAAEDERSQTSEIEPVWPTYGPRGVRKPEPALRSSMGSI